MLLLLPLVLPPLGKLQSARDVVDLGNVHHRDVPDWQIQHRCDSLDDPLRRYLLL